MDKNYKRILDLVDETVKILFVMNLISRCLPLVFLILTRKVDEKRISLVEFEW